MRKQSRIHRRWMGSHTLVFLLVMADLAGAALSYLVGSLIPPYIWSLLNWAWHILRDFIDVLKAALQPDGIFFVCLIAGMVLGLILMLILAEVPSSYSYRREWGKGVRAFFATLAAAFLCWIILALFLHHETSVIVPSLPSFHLAIHQWWGLAWLSYYLVAHSISLISASAQSLIVQGQSLYQFRPAPRRQPGEVAQEKDLPRPRRLLLTASTPPARPPAYQASVPVSRGHPEAPKWKLIDRCYRLYRKALTRFSTSPIDLKTPDGFRYYEGGQQVYWFKHTLLLPKDWLHPDWDRLLLPELARQLLYYNTPDLRIFELLGSYPRTSRTMLIFLLTGNFFWLPSTVKIVAGTRWQGERVLDADRFAYLLGEGMRLRERLRQEQEANQRAGLVDSEFPTLDERIEQLTALISEEAKQLRALGYRWQTTQKHLQSPKGGE